MRLHIILFSLFDQDSYNEHTMISLILWGGRQRAICIPLMNARPLILKSSCSLPSYYKYKLIFNKSTNRIYSFYEHATQQVNVSMAHLVQTNLHTVVCLLAVHTHVHVHSLCPSYCIYWLNDRWGGPHKCLCCFLCRYLCDRCSSGDWIDKWTLSCCQCCKTSTETLTITMPPKSCCTWELSHCFCSGTELKRALSFSASRQSS